MDYIQVTFRTDECEEYAADLLASELGEIGFDSFEETNRGMVGYCPTSVFSLDTMTDTLSHLEISNPDKISYRISEVADQNWNAVWEQNGYEPIVIDHRCSIHASHIVMPDNYQYDLRINPVQSFGTGYHQTTRMILRWILDNDFSQKRVLDMGCGTAVLGILAAMRGAASVVGIDIDRWAWQNAKDNCKENNIDCAKILLGDATLLSNYSKEFDIIFANINRNILIADMAHYADAMTAEAKLVTSGYYLADLPLVRAEAEQCGLSYISHQTDDEWTAAIFQKA